MPAAANWPARSRIHFRAPSVMTGDTESISSQSPSVASLAQVVRDAWPGSSLPSTQSRTARAWSHALFGTSSVSIGCVDHTCTTPLTGLRAARSASRIERRLNIRRPPPRRSCAAPAVSVTVTSVPALAAER